MAKAKKTIDISERLTRQPRHSGEAAGDPAVPTRMTVTLDQLVPYDRNPRQARNPRYEEIKDSIRYRGLDEPPSITRRPGSDNYMIRRGGNTRLQILNELWEETKEDRFYRIDCMFHPWVDDEDALAGHLVENDMRGGMLLIERALGAKQWIEMLEEKAGGAISQRKAAEAMTERGWKMDQSNLSVLLYAAENLLPVIPDALWAGAGKPLVKSLRSLEKGYQTYWDAIVELSDEPPAVDWSSLWMETLKEFDDIKFDIPEFRRTLDFKAADALVISHNTLRSEVDAILEGGKPPTERPIDTFVERPPFSEEPKQALETSGGRIPSQPGSDQGRSRGKPSPDKTAPIPSSAPGFGSVGNSSQEGSTGEPTPLQVEHTSSEFGSTLGSLSVGELRDRAYEAARSYMSELGLEHLVESTRNVVETKNGLGFGFHLLPLSEPVPALHRPYYWLLMNQLLSTLQQVTHTQAKQNVQACFPESLDTVVATLYPETDNATDMQQAMLTDLYELHWLRTTPESVVGVSHPNRMLYDAMNELEQCIAALRQAVDDDVDSLFISS